jgi:hypothetical protein
MVSSSGDGLDCQQSKADTKVVMSYNMGNVALLQGLAEKREKEKSFSSSSDLE